MSDPALLLATLEVAVPMWQDRVRGLTPEERADRGVVLSQIVAEHGDNILFRGPHTREAFNALAEGLALASMAPGGVTFLGRRWEGLT